jgi:integrase
MDGLLLYIFFSVKFYWYSKNRAVMINHYKSSRIIRSFGDRIKINVILRNGNSFQVIFYISKQKKTLSFNKNETEAYRIAKALAYDLDNGKVELLDLKPLQPKEIINLYQQEKDKTKLTIIQSINKQSNLNLKDIWQQYKTLAINKTAKTTQITAWKNTDNLLSKLSDDETNLSNIDKLGNTCLKYYSISFVRRCFNDLQSALNVIVNSKTLGSKKSLNNDFNLTKQLPKEQKSKIEYYKQNEVIEILEYLKHSPSSYYYNYTVFCAMTGVRPSEAIALIASDIKVSQGKMQVIINKAFVKGVLNPHTKNYKIRIIPLSQKLIEIMTEYLKHLDSHLLFPSIEGGYLDSQNFNRRHFKPLVLDLVSQGKIDKYLRPYCLRHSYATNLIRNGVDISTIAGLLGDNIQTVIENYIASDYENAQLPDIY